MNYFTSLWNWVDLISVVMIIVMTLKMTYGQTNPTVYLGAAIAYLIYNISMLSYLRMFRQSSYFVRMFNKVIYDIRTFMFMFVLFIFQFAVIFLMLSRGNTGTPYFEDTSFGYLF
jgi:hypothetical protein